MTATVTVDGADQLARTLHGFADDVQHLDAAHAAAGDLVQSAVRARSRRRSGRLAASFTAAPAAGGVQVGSHLVYAPVQEFGWARRHITPSRALTSAFAASQGAIEQVYFAAVDAAMGKVQGA